MALWKFTNTNKYGNLRSRIIYHPDGEIFNLNLKEFGDFADVQPFKYVYEHSLIPPHLFVDQDGQKYITPTWQKVVPKTTLNDIKWVKPNLAKPKPIKPTPQKNEWLFESSSNAGHFYKVTQVGVTYRCNCPGGWRAKDRQCKHIKEVKANV